MSLEKYRRKRRFEVTPEPAGKRAGSRPGSLRAVASSWCRSTHPVDYAGFEGVIPEGEYGAGTVEIWDQGTWEPESDDVDAALKKGDLKFTLRGRKLKGSWVLVRTRGFPPGSSRESWLLIKHRDRYASSAAGGL